MKKWLKRIGIFLGILIIFAILTSPTTEKYTDGDISNVNPMFLVAVNTVNHSTHVVTFNEYQRDQTSANPKFSPFQPSSKVYTTACGRVKFTCDISLEPPNIYTIRYGGLFGEGTVNSYRVEGKKIIPLSFTCLKDFCNDS